MRSSKRKYRIFRLRGTGCRFFDSRNETDESMKRLVIAKSGRWQIHSIAHMWNDSEESRDEMHSIAVCTWLCIGLLLLHFAFAFCICCLNRTLKKTARVAQQRKEKKPSPRQVSSQGDRKWKKVSDRPKSMPPRPAQHSCRC